MSTKRPALIQQGAKAAMGDHYDSKVGDMLVKCINHGIQAQQIKGHETAPPSPKSPGM